MNRRTGMIVGAAISFGLAALFGVVAVWFFVGVYNESGWAAIVADPASVWDGVATASEVLIPLIVLATPGLFLLRKLRRKL